MKNTFYLLIVLLLSTRVFATEYYSCSGTTWGIGAYDAINNNVLWCTSAACVTPAPVSLSTDAVAGSGNIYHIRGNITQNTGVNGWTNSSIIVETGATFTRSRNIDNVNLTVQSGGIFNLTGTLYYSNSYTVNIYGDANIIGTIDGARNLNVTGTFDCSEIKSPVGVVTNISGSGVVTTPSIRIYGTINNSSNITATNTTMYNGTLNNQLGGTITANSIVESNEANTTSQFNNYGETTVTGSYAPRSTRNEGKLTLKNINYVNNHKLTIDNTGLLTVNLNQDLDTYEREINNIGGTIDFKGTLALSKSNNKIYNNSGGIIQTAGSFTFKEGVFENGRNKAGTRDKTSKLLLGNNDFLLTNSASAYNNGLMSMKAISFSAGPTVINDCDGIIDVSGTGSVFNSNTNLINGGIINFRDATTIQDAIVKNGKSVTGLTCDGIVNLYGSLTLLNAGCISGGYVNLMKPGLLHQDGLCVLSAHVIKLPITIISFEGDRQNNSIKLKWSTLSEQNNSSFDLEKIIEDNSYTLISTIEGAGTSSTKHSYAYSDLNPNNGVNYYRLSQTDFDGQKRYFAPIAVHYSNMEALIYPTVIHGDDIVNVQMSSITEVVPFQIISQNGKVLNTGTISNEAELPSDLFQYGLNQLIIGSDNSIITTSIVKQ